MPGPLPAWLGRVLEPVYAAGIGWRNQRFDRGAGVVRLGVPVISVGNLSVGGTGKTPMVGHIVGLLLRRGVEPCIAMRGYVPRAGVKPRAAAGMAVGRMPREPDETDVYRRMFPGVAIVAQKDRAAGIGRWLESRGAGERNPGEGRPSDRPACVVLDDGFQHRRIARDLDIVLIDASRPPMDDRLLPAGWLREPVASLARADMVVATHAEIADAGVIAEIDSAVRRNSGRPLGAVTRHVWTGLVTGGGATGGEERVLPLDWLLGRRVAASCAIGNPAGFLHSLRRTLAADSTRAGELCGTLILPDHDPYDDAVVRALAGLARECSADAIVVTDKDWSKLRAVPEEAWPAPVVRPVLAMVFDRGGVELEERVLRVARPEAGNRHGA